MRLPEPIEKRGFFWLPTEPENQLPGSLRISVAGDVTLEVSGVFGDPLFAVQDMLGVDPPPKGEKPNLKRIVGNVEKDGAVILDECNRLDGSINFTGALSNSIYRAKFAFIGGNYDTAIDLEFSELRLSIEGLSEWLSTTGICVNSNLEQGSGSISFHTPESISIRLANEFDITFSFFMAFPSLSGLTTTATVTQSSYMGLRPNTPQSIDYYLPLLLKLSDFLYFAIDQPVSINSITGFLNGKKKSTERPRSPIQVYCQASSRPETWTEIQWYDVLLTYGHIADQCEETLTKWLETYETLEPALNLYFASRSNAWQYRDVRFLHLAQAAETLHRRSSNDTEMPKDEFNSLLIELLENCPIARQEFVREKFSFANELSLRKRITSLIEPFQEFFGSQDEATSFVSKVVHTRNYFTHYNQSLEGKAAKREDLWKLCQKLEALFQLHLLGLVGIDPKPIVEGLIVKGYSRLGNKLKL